MIQIIETDKKTIASASGDFIGRRSAWQTLGTSTNGVMTAAEAIKAAGLDSPVTKQPCFAFVNGEYVEVEGKWVTGSSDPRQKNIWRPHGVVGDQYEIVQNSEQFEMLDAIRDDSGAAYETAGSIGNGKSVFVTMKLPTSLKFNGGEDVVDLYLLAQNSHDGTKAFTIAVTPLRISCTNQLTMAVRNAKRVFRMKHTKNVLGRVNEAREALGLTFDYVEEFEREVQKLIDRDMSDQQFETFAKDFTGYGTNKFPSPKETRAEKAFEQLVDLWHADTQLVAGRNAWAAYNAVTEYADWFSGTRKQRAVTDDEARAYRTMSLSAERFKDRAYKMLQSV